MNAPADLAARRLPAGVERYRETPEFTPETVPAGLLNDHATREGVWGLLEVLQHEVTFHDTETGEERNVKAGESQTIPPTSRHRISPGEAARFRVAFNK